MSMITDASPGRLPRSLGEPPSHPRQHWSALDPLVQFGGSVAMSRILGVREALGTGGPTLQGHLQGHAALLRRLRAESTLTGHEGCVNHLRWSTSGQLLASGSDDTRVILWDYASRTQRAVIETGHVLNIFAVCFVPETNDHILATGAMDKEVRVHYAPFRPESTKRFRFHRGRVKDLAASPGVPKVFWSVAEDGIVHQFDVRALPRSDGGTAAGGEGQDDPSGVLIRLGKGRGGYGLRGMAMAVHPLDPTKLVVACGDYYTRLYDRRMLRTRAYTSPHRAATSSDASGDSEHRSSPEATVPIEVFAPPHLHLDGPCDAGTRRRHDDCHGTSIQFSSDGREILTNYHNDHIYLFDVRSGKREPTTIYDKSEPPVIPSRTWENGRYMDSSTVPLPIAREEILALHSKGLVSLLAKSYTRALECFARAIGAARLDSMSTSFRKDLFHNAAKAYLGRGWRADYHLAAVHAKLAMTVEPSDKAVELTYIKALHACRRGRHTIHQAQQYQARHPDSEGDVEDILKEATTSLSRRRDRHLRVFRRPAESSSDEDHDEENSDDSDGELHVEEEPVPSDSEDNDEHTQSQDQSTTDETFWTSRTCSGIEVNCDAVKRYIGYCNLQTDIKEATFFGPKDSFIVAGSDDGRAYIWDKKTGVLLNAIDADADIVNCVQPHPTDTCLATSGIENVIRLWTPTGDSESSPLPRDLEEMVENNQSQMSESGNYYIHGANPNIIRLIFQSGEHEGVQECATS